MVIPMQLFTFACTVASARALGVAQGWDAEGHVDDDAWLHVLGTIGLVVFGVLYLALVVRAMTREPRYRAAESLGEADRERVHAAIRAVEERTVGEVLPVVVERSDRHPGASWLAAFLFAVLGSLLLAEWMPWDHHLLLLLVQAVLGGVGFGTTLLFRDFLRLFVSEKRATEMAEEQATQEFFRHELQTTEGRTGVLLFVSLLERRVIVLADEGIHAKVDAEVWQRADEAVLRGIVQGSLTDGLVAGIEEVGTVLAEHFPWTEGDRNELPDRLIVRAE